ncbi:hypothetical protein ACMYR2_2384 [Nitrobacter sp. TKz-YC01]
MRKWSLRKICIHAALNFQNPLGWLVGDEFLYRCFCGQSLHLDARLESEDASRGRGE